MDIVILYQGVIRKAAGVGSERLRILPGTTVREACERMVARHGADMRNLLFTADGKLGGDIRITVNDRVLHDRGERVVLRKGDDLAFFTTPSGA